MSWVCPYQINNECTRLKKACQPLQDGCVMEGKAAFIDSPLDRVNENRAQKEKNQKRNVRLPSAAQPQPNFLYESGEIASEKTLAMTATMHFDGTLHVVIASEAKQSFTHKKRHLLKGVCEKTY
ncbi:MAG: hypothetical protein IT420_05230, partial [Candidatus Brocadia sp.]|nr:hypothetical protein [Candidatus Brocadia sp.]